MKLPVCYFVVVNNCVAYKPCAAEKEISMKKILITGGTTFVSKYVAKYFVEHGYEI